MHFRRIPFFSHQLVKKPGHIKRLSITRFLAVFLVPFSLLASVPTQMVQAQAKYADNGVQLFSKENQNQYPGFLKPRAQSGVSQPAGMNKSFLPILIPAGEVSTLSIVIYNPNNFPLTLSNTPAAWTDNLPVGVTFASPLNTTTSCGGTVSAVGNTLSLIGGTVPAQVGSTRGSCTVTVWVTSVITGNHVNVIPDGNLSATDPTGTIQITNRSDDGNGAQATLQVTTIQPPSLSKSFNANTVWVGQNSVLSINIRNNDPYYSLTNVYLNDTLPTDVVIGTPALPLNWNSNCGGSASVTEPGGNPLAPGDTALRINSATIARNTTCTIMVNVVSNLQGVYLNSIPAHAIQSQQAVTNSAAATAQLNVQRMGSAKSFSPNSFQAGGTSTLSIILRNPGSAQTDIAFTDNLPSGLTLVGPPLTPQCGGTVNYSSSLDALTLSGGSLPSGTIGTPAECTILAQVTSSITGNYTNRIPAGAISFTQGGFTYTNVLPASANVNVYNPGEGMPGGGNNSNKWFNPSSIPVGANSRLNIQLRAPADTALTGVTLTDALPASLHVAAVPNPSTSGCNASSTPVFNPAAGSTLLTLSNASIAQAGLCTLSVNITSDTVGIFTNTISPANITNNEGRNIAGNISADLYVSGLSVAKAFFPPTVAINGESTLTITITNTNLKQVENTSLTDNLPAGTLVAPTPDLSFTCPGASVSADTGTSSIVMTGGIIPAQVGSIAGICTINVDVVGLTNGTKTNPIEAGAVFGTLQGTSTSVRNLSRVTADLTVSPLFIRVVKGFQPTGVFGGSASTLTITLVNPTTAPLTGVSLTDNLPQGTGGGMSVANPPAASTGTCGGVFNPVPGDISLNYTGGYLPPSGSCSLSVNVVMNVNDNLTNTIGINDVHTTNGAINLQSTSASLSNLGGVTVIKAFSPNPIYAGIGNSSTLTITIQNNDGFSLSEMGLTDSLPSGVTFLSPPLSPQCGGVISTSTSGLGIDSLTMVNGSLAANASCQIVAQVTAPTVGAYTNCINSGTLHTRENESNPNDSCDTLVVNWVPQPPSIAKSFTPALIATGEISQLHFVLTNPPANTVPLTGVAFTDTLPAGVTLASVPNPAQCGGTVTSTLNSISLAGGTIPVHGTCSIDAAVTSATGGSYDNTTGKVTSSNGGDGNPSNTATLTVVAPPVISKAFSPSTINAGGVSALTFTINNPTENTVSLTGVTFSDILPVPLKVANPAAASTSGCGIPVFSPLPGDTTLSFNGGTIPVTGNCTVSVDVTFSNGGVYNNISSLVTSTNGGAGNSAGATLTVNGAGLTLQKSTSTANFKVGGDIIAYSYLLTNSGNATLYSPFTVTDNKTTVTCPGLPASLAPNDSITCSATYTVNAADVSSKFVTNIATAHAADTSGGPANVDSNPSSVTVNLAALALRKTSPTPSFQVAGNLIQYDYTLTNTGLVTLYAPFTVADDHIGTINCQQPPIVTQLAPGANLVCTSRTYSVTSTDVNNGFVTNIASATAADSSGGLANVNSNTDSVTVYKVGPPSISKVFSPNPITAGSISTLTFTISNNNSVSLTGVSFSDILPVGLEAASPPDGNQCGGTVTTSINLGRTVIDLTGGSIVAGASCTVIVDVTAGNGGTYVNTSGTVGSTNGGSGNRATDTLVVLEPPVIAKNFSPNTINDGDTSTLTITISNPGNNPSGLSGVAFDDNFPPGLVVAPVPNATTTNCGLPTFSPAAGDGSLNFSGGVVATGTPCLVTVDVTGPAGVYHNATGPVTSTNGGTGVGSNIATLTVSKVADLGIQKTTAVLAVSRSEAVTYTVVVSNNGPSDAVGARVFDTFPSTLTGITWSCTATSPDSCTASGSGNINDTVDIKVGNSITYIIAASVTNSATTSVSNTASVNPPIGIVDLDQSNNISTVTTPLNLLNIIKVANPDVYYALGETINYSYTITNDGTSVLNLTPVSDDKLPLNCGALPVTLVHNATHLCSASHVITQLDLDNRFITNQVFATALDPDGDTINSNTATETVSAGLLHLIKTVTSGNPYDSIGDIVQYSYLLTNIGNINLTGAGIGGRFTVSDDQATVTCPASPTTLAPDESVVCTASHSVTQADLDAGFITNTATGHALNGNDIVNSNTASQTVSASPRFTVTKDDGVTQTVPGATLIYEMTVTNIGGQDATGVFITDIIPNEVENPVVLSISGAGLSTADSEITAGTLRVPSGTGTFTLPRGETVTIRLQVQVKNPVPNNPPSFSNTVTATDDGTHSPGQTPVTGQATDTNALRPLQKTLVALSQHPQGKKVYIGELLTYDVTFIVAPGTLKNLHLVDTMDTGLAVVRCDNISVNPGIGIVEDPAHPFNNNADGTAVCPGVANLPSSSFNPTPPIGPPNAGHIVNFNFGTVQNTGTEDETITVRYAVVVLNVANNVRGVQLDNRAHWSWDGSDPGLIQFAGPVTIVEPTLTIKKSVDNSHPLPGHVVTFTITIANDGPGTNSDAFDVVIHDRVPTGLIYVPGSLVFGGLMPTSWSDLGAPVLTATWNTLPIGISATITFQATVQLGHGGGARNTANVEWSSEPGDFRSPQSPFNSYSTERFFDPNSAVNVYGTSSSALVHVPALPETGFAPGRLTNLPAQPLSKRYDSLDDLRLQIPVLGVDVPIVGVPAGDTSWDLTWLNDEAGYLEGTAYPTWNGTSGITAHVYDANGNPGPFVNLSKLKWGDQVIVESNGQKYIYEVRENIKTWEGDLSVLKHEETPWLTLLTCQGFNPETGKYSWRIAVRAALVRVE